MAPNWEQFDDAIRAENLDDPDLAVFNLAPGFDFNGRLYAIPVVPKEPSWAEFLRNGFSDFTATPTAMNRAVAVLQVGIDDIDRFFAATFGSGRFLLRADAFEKKYGLRVALNAIYAGDQSELVVSDRLRQVGVTRVAKNTIHTRRQSNRNAAFQDFGVDLSSDLLGAVTGVPGDTKAWGSRLSGADSLRVQVVEDFQQLGSLCRSLDRMRNEENYRVRFGSIDNIRTAPPEDIPALEAQLLKTIGQSPEKVTLAPPTLLDFDRVSRFRFSIDKQTFDDLRFEDYLQRLEAPSKEVTIEALKSQRVEALDEAGDAFQSWPLFETLDAEIVVDSGTYLLVDGSFFGVSTEMMAELDRFVDALEESDVKLPLSKYVTTTDKKTKKKTTREETEGAYNERAAAILKQVLLDKEMVRVRGKADPVEICDVFTDKRQFIHVKRKFSSSSLSHLFAQGAVSGDLFVRSNDYREKIRSKLKTSSFKALIPTGRPNTSRYEIVYAIIGTWKGAKLSRKLPFFSKVNLRRHTNDLRAAGFRVTYSRIELK